MQFPGPVMISRAVPVAGLAAHLNRGLQRVATDALLTGLLSFARRIANLDAAALSRPVSLRNARRLATPTSIPLRAGHFTGEKFGSAARFNDRPPHAGMTGDSPPGKLCLGNGEPGLPRRPAVRRGHPGRDLAYTLVTSMITADRRSTERALLDECRHVPAACVAPLICARALP